MSKYTVLRNKNDWLNNYRGQTYNAKLQDILMKGILEEHYKIKNNMSSKTDNGFLEVLGKKCIVSCLEPETKEILALGSSSLLKDEITGRIIDNLLTDNFGLFWAGCFAVPATTSGFSTLKDDGGTSTGNSTYTNDTGETWWHLQAGGLQDLGTLIKMGSGSTAVNRADFKIETDLPTAPESGYINTNAGAYTVNNTVIYQADANPTGGSGTVRESGTFGKWAIGSGSSAKIMITHDAVSPTVPFTAGKLLRSAYTWSMGCS